LDSHAQLLRHARHATIDIPTDIFRHNMYVVDKKNVIVSEDRRATSFNIAKKELKQNAHYKWRMFSICIGKKVHINFLLL
jgi:hypothetical protein